MILRKSRWKNHFSLKEHTQSHEETVTTIFFVSVLNWKEKRPPIPDSVCDILRLIKVLMLLTLTLLTSHKRGWDTGP